MARADELTSEATQQLERRATIVKILREQAVGRQSDLVRLLHKLGHEATQSSVSRDLRELGVLKAGDRYVLMPEVQERVNGDFDALAGFVREIHSAGSTLTVVKTTIGAAQSVAVAVDRAAMARGGRHDFRRRYDLHCHAGRQSAKKGAAAPAFHLPRLIP